MNRRTLVIAIGLLFAVCFGLHFYVQWDMKRQVEEVPPWLVEWRAALEHHEAESKRLREKSRVLRAERQALRQARDANRISREEYKQASGKLTARQNALIREKREQEAALRAAEAKTVKGGNN